MQFVKDGQSAAVKQREGVELVEAELTMGEQHYVKPRPPNAHCTGADNNDQPDDVIDPEPCTELLISGADDHIPENLNSEKVESIAQITPDTDSRVCWRPQRQCFVS